MVKQSESTTSVSKAFNFLFHSSDYQCSTDQLTAGQITPNLNFLHWSPTNSQIKKETGCSTES